MRTKAQINRPMQVYGKQTARGNTGERKAAEILRAEGYSVSYSAAHPHGAADLIAVKGKTTRKIQVKRISSRIFNSAETARKRIAGKPFNLKTLPAGLELWVFDAAGHLYKFRR